MRRDETERDKEIQRNTEQYRTIQSNTEQYREKHRDAAWPAADTSVKDTLKYESEK